MTSNRLWALLLVLGGLLILASQSMFIVDQREQAIVLNLGKPVRTINAPGAPGAGLNFKVPITESVVKFDRRNLSIDSEGEEITGADNNRLVVDAFVRYRITDPLAFYRTLRDERTASDRIERLVDSSLRQVLGTATQNDIIAGRRAQLMQITRQDVARRVKAAGLGIQIIDVRIRRTDLPDANLGFVYRRMQTNREQEAQRIRAEGEQQKREIRAQADREVLVTLAQAQEQGEIVRGQGDAARTRIFAQSFGRDPAFAAFYRSMQAYEEALGTGDTTMVLSPDSAFFKYFERGPNAR